MVGEALTNALLSIRKLLLDLVLKQELLLACGRGRIRHLNLTTEKATCLIRSRESHHFRVVALLTPCTLAPSVSAGGLRQSAIPASSFYFLSGFVLALLGGAAAWLFKALFLKDILSRGRDQTRHLFTEIPQDHIVTLIIEILAMRIEAIALVESS
jgi:hypothetical protein